MEVTVKQKFIHRAPRKLRLIGDLVRGWHAQKASDQLRFIPKAAARDLFKALTSAIAAAKNNNMDLENVFIGELRIDEGPRLKRRIIGSRGRSTPFHKQMSHITLKLIEKEKSVQEKSPKENKPANQSKEVSKNKQLKENHGTKS